LTGGAVLIAGIWAGACWGTAGQLPLLVSGGIGLVLAAALAAAGHRFTPPSQGTTKPAKPPNT
jgi:hypothetical protein